MTVKLMVVQYISIRINFHHEFFFPSYWFHFKMDLGAEKQVHAMPHSVAVLTFGIKLAAKKETANSIHVSQNQISVGTCVCVCVLFAK